MKNIRLQSAGVTCEKPIIKLPKLQSFTNIIGILVKNDYFLGNYQLGTGLFF